MKSRPDNTRITSTEVVCPDDTNPMHLLKGGRLLQWMDNTAAICAQTFARTVCVTAGMDQVRFIRPARVGDMVTVTAIIESTRNTSMTIVVTAHARSVGDTDSNLITEGRFTFVSIDQAGRPLALRQTADTQEAR